VGRRICLNVSVLMSRNIGVPRRQQRRRQEVGGVGLGAGPDTEGRSSSCTTDATDGAKQEGG
jgi:hypothetical protein